MADFYNTQTLDGFTMKLWRGERMCLIGFDVESPPADLVGFAIECRFPGTDVFKPLPNRIAFAYDEPTHSAVDGQRKYSSLEAPFQKFRWVHVPHEVDQGTFTYRGRMMHMANDGQLVSGTAIELAIDLDPISYEGILDIGFTRGFTSSQAFRDRVPAGVKVDVYGKSLIPSKTKDGLDHPKTETAMYQWLGFEAVSMIFAVLDEVLRQPDTTLDVFAYDFNEPDILARLEALGSRLRIIIDDAGDHAAPDSCETRAASRLLASAGADRVRRSHFHGLQHHKVLIARRNGKPYQVLCGSTNFSFRGCYVQNNNALLFKHLEVADLFGRVFDASFSDPKNFEASDLAQKWHVIETGTATTAGPRLHFCFSPHSGSDLSLSPIGGAIDQASRSVLFNIAFLNQITSGPLYESISRLYKRPVFNYGVTDKASGMDVIKPDGTSAEVDFAYLAKYAPEPFRSEWSGGTGISVHNKFVVTDFNLPSAKVFTGSSNLSISGEEKNGDHLVLIEDQKIAVVYAIQALLIFDHLHFRSVMQKAFSSADETQGKQPPPLLLKKPTAISGQPAWFEAYYVAGSQKQGDRQLFSH
ncbi:phospholipase D-like domain-containing protein [Pseudomonas sp. GM17]|uniref:phospholipase D-like domain-containing protein n=1 Tax=Pseudomonas sp. GM17 TaxID=1144323 RepID=UPI00027272F8|nr:phospholipase D-like domain-containing protein [Pseudomonas sp. GM17]WIE47523.1 phospholipase D-like domain-containing protein [Pseudomonas sp. GM17]